MIFSDDGQNGSSHFSKLPKSKYKTMYISHILEDFYVQYML